MFIPEYFRVREHATAVAFMRANPFAILVSSTAEGPFATHVPLIIREDVIGAGDDSMILRGHVAKANPHWRYLEEQPESLVIFHGPHAYISPTNYVTHENVPTWNYGAVHAYGKVRMFTAPGELLGVLDELIPLFEPTYAEQWASLSETYRERMLNHIVGFEIGVTKIEAKFKLSQNRTHQEQENVIESLGASRDTVVSGISRLMRDQGLGLKK